MSTHKAETTIAAPHDVVWDALVTNKFSAWPAGMDVSTFGEELREGTEVHTSLNNILPGISGLVVSRVVYCDPIPGVNTVTGSRISTQLVRTEGLFIPPKRADTVIDVMRTEDERITQVHVLLDIGFSFMGRLIDAAAKPVINQKLQPGIDEARVLLEAEYARQKT